MTDQPDEPFGLRSTRMSAFDRPFVHDNDIVVPDGVADRPDGAVTAGTLAGFKYRYSSHATAILRRLIMPFLATHTPIVEHY